MTRTLLAAALVLLVAGCGGGKARVKGRVVENGQPVTFPPTSAAIELTPVGPDGRPDAAKAFTAVVNEDGTFEVAASGGELPPGKYQVAFKGSGPLTTKYKGLAPATRDLKAGSNDLTIDLAKPEG